MIAKVCKNPPQKRKIDTLKTSSSQGTPPITKFLKRIETPQKISNVTQITCQEITPVSNVQAKVESKLKPNRKNSEDDDESSITSEEERLMILQLKNGPDWVDPNKHCPWCGFEGAACHNIKYGRYLERCVLRNIHFYKSCDAEVDTQECEKLFHDLYFHLMEFEDYKLCPTMIMSEDVSVSLPHCIECGSYWTVLQSLYHDDKVAKIVEK